MTESDHLYAQPIEHINEFKFDTEVAKVFSDMISRSVPGYAQIIELITTLSSLYAKPGSVCYDLGCALGASSVAMSIGINMPSQQIIGIDNSTAMIAKAEKNIQAIAPKTPIKLLCQDIQRSQFQISSFVCMNFTLQFIPIAQRTALLKKIYRSLQKEGVLLLSEKIDFTDAWTQASINKIHYAFKKDKGYSALEISQKRTALEKSMHLETLEQHKNRLSRIGFRHIMVYFQCVNFISLLAYK